MINFMDKHKRSQTYCAELRDATGRKIEVDDVVAYAVSLGRSAGMQIATVVGFNDKGSIRLKIWEEFRQTYGNKEIVTVQYSDRMVILDQPIGVLYGTN